MSAPRGVLLFIDDDADILDAVGPLLALHGWTVAEAGDGLEALEWLRVNPPPRLILLDLKMPRCDGYEFRRLQLCDARLALVPVVVMTADGRVHEGDVGLAGLRIVHKPPDFDELMLVLASAAAAATAADSTG